MKNTPLNLLDHTQTKWNDFNFALQNQLLTYNSIKLSVTSLFEERLKMLNQDQYLTIIFKVKMENENIRSISLSQTIQLKDTLKLYSLFKEYWDIRSDDYHVTKIHSIIFTYAIFPLETIKHSKLTRASKVLRISNKRFKFSGFNLPMTMDISQWGNIEYFNDYKQAVVAKFNSNAYYHVSLFDKYIEVSLKENDVTLISWKDIMRNKNELSSFTRLINDTHEYIFEKGEVILKKIKRKVPFLKAINFSIYRSENIITMDLETKSIYKNNKEVLIPICVSLYDGKNKRSFHISNFKNKDLMLEQSIQYLMISKYSGHKVYLHNFSYFDGIFLMRSLSKLAVELRPIMRDGRIIELRFKFGTKYVLYFRDSYLLLPSSLSSLARNFSVENKSVFPLKFLNEQKGQNIAMDYIGPVPSFSYFYNISKQQYDEYSLLFKEKDWNMKEELIKYCEQDVITLHQVITEFSKLIYNLFRIDILKYPTLPSLAFAIYRSSFLKDHKIPLINGEMYDNIKEGYTGGAVDVYRPCGNKIYRYDVNSLYPSVMKYKMMPIGTPVYFEGDILKIDTDAFGFFNVKVETPTKMSIPILQCKVKTEKGGIRTIAGLGTWESTHFSEEVKRAMREGYKFKVTSGYIFEKGYIFNEYVDFLYSMKLKSEKGSPNYTISKLLLNSLYGRLGMSPNMENTIIINESDSFEFSQEYLVSNIMDLQNGKILMTYIDTLEKFNTRTLNISVPISAAITAYARMHMTDFKLMKGVKIYYSDTDSIDIDKPLNAKHIGKELGKMKLEHIFDKIVYLAPKVYGGLSSGQELVKIKGLKNPVSLDELTSLLEKDKKLSVYQDKWYRNMSQAEISIKNEIYTVMVTDNKRVLIYDNKNKLIRTKPLLLKNGNIINKDNTKSD